MARSALLMLRDWRDDSYTIYVFKQIFSTPPQEIDGDLIAARLGEIFRSFLDMKDESRLDNAEQPRGNIRYYCDNDRVDMTARWTLSPDPPLSQRPNDYIPQFWRPRWPIVIKGQYQDWVDRANWVTMGPTLGCQAPGNVNLAKTYEPTILEIADAYFFGSDYSESEVLAVVTICDAILDLSRPSSIDDLMEPRVDLSRLRNGISELMFVPAIVILNEFFRFPPWWRTDIRGEQLGNLASSWLDVLRIEDPSESFQKTFSITYFALLARLKDHGWCLPGPGDDLIAGRLTACG